MPTARKAAPAPGSAVLQDNFPVVALVDSVAEPVEPSWKNPFDDCHQAGLLLANNAFNFAVIQAKALPLREAGERNAAAEGHDLEQASQRGL